MSETIDNTEVKLKIVEEHWTPERFLSVTGDSLDYLHGNGVEFDDSEVTHITREPTLEELQVALPIATKELEKAQIGVSTHNIIKRQNKGLVAALYVTGLAVSLVVPHITPEESREDSFEASAQMLIAVNAIALGCVVARRRQESRPNFNEWEEREAQELANLTALEAAIQRGIEEYEADTMVDEDFVGVLSKREYFTIDGENVPVKTYEDRTTDPDFVTARSFTEDGVYVLQWRELSEQGEANGSSLLSTPKNVKKSLGLDSAVLQRFMSGEISAEEAGPDFFVAADGTKGIIVDEGTFDMLQGLTSEPAYARSSFEAQMTDFDDEDPLDSQHLVVGDGTRA